MNTLVKDRNTLKKLVESYGKKDVLNFVKRLNENTNNMTTNLLICVDTSVSIDFELYDNYSINDLLDICNIDYKELDPNAKVKIAAFADKGFYYINDVKNINTSILSNIRKNMISGGTRFKELLNDIYKTSREYGPYTDVIIVTDEDVYQSEHIITPWIEDNKRTFDTYVVIGYNGTMECIYDGKQ